MRITSTRKLRAEFWRQHPNLTVYRSRGRQNRQPTDVRVAWCDWVDHMHRAGRISERLAEGAEL